ncbi:MAG: hypothetical protein M1830_003708 [Pleopsidium flavum]|nr:MAG: hypothetical protein M1830_003708 [Pleopsidium flavum]
MGEREREHDTVRHAAKDGSGELKGPEQTHLQEQGKDLEQGQHRSLPAEGQAPYPNRSQTSLRLQGANSPPSAPGSRNAPETQDDYAWGPWDPCFPHPNPHVPLNSPLYHSTRVIRIKRDWMIAGDRAPTFSNLYPEILEPVLPEQEFRTIVRHVNEELIQAFDPWSWRNWLDALLGLLTGWLWEDLGLTAVKRRLKAVENWLEEWNTKVGERDGVRVVGLRRTGYLSLDIQIPDPHIVVVGPESRPGSRPATRPTTAGNIANGEQQQQRAQPQPTPSTHLDHR